MTLITALFWILALVNLTPALAAISPRQISRLYGVDLQDKVMITLLTHRAVLLGLVGGALAWAAHLESLRWPALIGGAFSMASFIVICARRGQLKGRLNRIVLVDAFALPIVVVLAVIMYVK